MKLATIVIFTYRRVPNKLIESLLKNNLSNNSNLIVYSDGYKNSHDKNDILGVRAYLQKIVGFKSVKIVEASKNKGLANSIIDGVSEVLNTTEKIIVLEDDLIVSKDFLDYMNSALEFYNNDKKIWSISGYGPNLPCLEGYDKDVYLSTRGSSWGWATWKDRWGSVDWDVTDFKKLTYDKLMRKKFELGGNDMHKMLELQILGKIDSWAIRWCFSQFLQEKYTVYPIESKILNDGFSDDKGIHNNGNSSKWDVVISDKKINFENIKLEENIVQCWKNYHNINLFTKIGYFLKKYMGYKMAKKIIETIKKYKTPNTSL